MVLAWWLHRARMQPWPHPQTQKDLLQTAPGNVSRVQPPFDPSLDKWGVAANTFKNFESRYCLAVMNFLVRLGGCYRSAPALTRGDSRGKSLLKVVPALRRGKTRYAT